MNYIVKSNFIKQESEQGVASFIRTLTNMFLCCFIFWLDSKTDNRTFFIAEYDPDFNVEEVKELLNDSEETKDVN